MWNRQYNIDARLQFVYRINSIRYFSMDSSIYLMLPNKTFYFFHTSNGLESCWEDPTENQARDLRDEKQVWSISLSLSTFTMYLVFHLHFAAVGERSKMPSRCRRIV